MAATPQLMKGASLMNSIQPPALQVDGWLNTPAPLTLADLRGQVVVLHAFQMLCPGCVSHGLPQAARVHEAFAGQPLQVIGLHSVFEHHAVMNRAALEAFVHEYRLRFPIAIDAPGAGTPLPRTMQALGLRGTPSLVLIDKAGRIALHHFGAIDDLALGARIGRLLAEAAPAAGAGAHGAAASAAASPADAAGSACDGDTCVAA